MHKLKRLAYFFLVFFVPLIAKSAENPKGLTKKSISRYKIKTTRQEMKELDFLIDEFRSRIMNDILGENDIDGQTKAYMKKIHKKINSKKIQSRMKIHKELYKTVIAAEGELRAYSFKIREQKEIGVFRIKRSPKQVLWDFLVKKLTLLEGLVEEGELKTRCFFRERRNLLSLVDTLKNNHFNLTEGEEFSLFYIEDQIERWEDLSKKKEDLSELDSDSIQRPVLKRQNAIKPQRRKPKELRA